MYLETLTVSQFRCWTYQEFSFSDGINYVNGPNGSGKSSLLEAIHYLSAGRSYRASKDATCIEWDSRTFSIHGDYTAADTSETTSLSLSYTRDQRSGSKRKKVAKVNGELIEKLSQLRDYLITVIFTPDDLTILKEGPSNRRDFMDELLSNCYENYLGTLKTYEKNRRQRNSLLKQPDFDDLLMDQYEETLIQTGRELVERRGELTPILEGPFAEFASDVLEYDQSAVEYDYKPDCPVGTLEDAVKSNRNRDRELGYTANGPHRDDWEVKIEGRDASRFASQGELRTLLLALKLSSNSVIIDQVSQEPIVLLDDLESELDTTRRNRVLTLLKSCPSQVVITGTGGLEPQDFRESSDCILSLEAG